MRFCYYYVFLIIHYSLISTKGSSDVSPNADEAGQPPHTEQRPLRASLCSAPPRQETPASTFWNLGRAWVSQTSAFRTEWAIVRETWAGNSRLQTEHMVLKGWNVSRSNKEPDFIILFLDFYILEPVVSELLSLNVLLIDCMARSSSGTDQNR